MEMLLVVMGGFLMLVAVALALSGLQLPEVGVIEIDKPYKIASAALVMAALSLFAGAALADEAIPGEASSINLWSFLVYFSLMVIGAWYHWHKMAVEGRVGGTFWDYLVADYPGRSVATLLCLLGATWVSCASGLADNLNPEVIFAMLSAGKLGIAQVNAAVAALVCGNGFDSAVNKGAA